MSGSLPPTFADFQRASLRNLQICILRASLRTARITLAPLPLWNTRVFSVLMKQMRDTWFLGQGESNGCLVKGPHRQWVSDD